MSKINKFWSAKSINRNFEFHWSHILAVLVLSGYFVISKINTAHAFLRDDLRTTFMQLFIFGTVFSFIFLYIFSHEKFFPFAREIEKKEEEKEKSYLKKYIKHGKMIATFIIGVIGGPIFLSLTTRLLLNGFKFRYLFILVTIFISTLVTLGAGRSLLFAFN